MKHTTLAIAGVLAVALAACGGPSEEAKEFYAKAMQGDASEMMLGDLALKRGESEGIKTYGQTLHQDHTAAGAAVKKAADEAGLKVPATPTREARDEHEKLAKLNGADFDKEFASYMVDDHKKDIEDFEKAAKSKDTKLAKLASDTLPVLRKHLQMAESLNQ